MKKVTVKVTIGSGPTSIYYTDTIPNLSARVFSPILLAGNALNDTINPNPRTAKGLVKALNDSDRELQRGYNRNHYELVA